MRNSLNNIKKKLYHEIFNIEKRTDINDKQKSEKIIKIFSTTCAAIATQPIPFADFFILTPIQAFMGTKIASIRGFPISESKAKEIIKELSSVIGMGFLAQQFIISGYKTFIPYLGAFTTIPMVYGMTYAMGKLMDNYFVQKIKNETIDPKKLKTIWNEVLKQKKKEGKKEKKDIISYRKKYEK